MLIEKAKDNIFCLLIEPYLFQLFDRVLGYFLNFYNVSFNPGAARKPHVNLLLKNTHAYLRSIQKSGEAKVMCRNVGISQCHPDALYCNGIPPRVMLDFEN